MAPPDLNSVPPSPRNGTTTPHAVQTSSPLAGHSPRPTSRRTSTIPSLPLASPGGNIPASAQTGHPFPPLSPVTTSGSFENGVPVRHPRPMTPAELHMELEKEQEAVVNRLTRELNALRAHSSSVASNTSTTSQQNTHLLDPSDPSSLPAPTQPAPDRRHRSSSSASVGLPLATASTPSAASRTPSISVSQSALSTTSRYEEVLLHKQELDEAKKENERLRNRVRELEAQIRGRRLSSAARSSAGQSRERSVASRSARAE
ncbi:Tubulin glycylase 3B [Venturia nashicola]|uniref:Tubulin glycylase 3B n=1 Tax=Venturia nashicola TaxID=86259 RepID=A0A4Z1PA19_9PEZI|nr:Tubulin glycylase 3B [Venturia nashicola]TLD37311.1 Tubulin glycylase 3B [Venturia nashicola]